MKKKRFLVIAESITRLQVIVEADSIEEANEIAQAMEEDDFESCQNGSFDIMDDETAEVDENDEVIKKKKK